jgi:DNA gyrase/topoisomerase IV subunit A
MEWVVALLAIGCLFLAFHIAMNYIKYKRLLGPRRERLDQAHEELEAKIAAAEKGLDEDRQHLQPLRDDVNDIDNQFHQARQQVNQERKGARLPPEAGGDGESNK